MAAFNSDALRLSAAMLCPRHMSSSGSVGEPPGAPGGVPPALLEHGICGGGELPAPVAFAPPPLALLPPLLQ